MNLPEGWEVRKFEQCIQKVIYSKKIKKNDFLKKGNFPIISQEKETINGFWNRAEDLFIIERPIVVFGDHTKVIKYIDFDFVIGADGVKILNPIEEINPKFFYYFLLNVDLSDLGYARHYRLLKEIDIYYPKSLSEQKRIVKKLDKIFAEIERAKANAERNLNNAKELFNSVVNGELLMVNGKLKDGWVEKKFCNIVEYTKKPKNLTLRNPIPYIPMELIPLNEKYITKNEYREKVTSGTFVKDGDLLLAKITPSFENGKQGIVKIKNVKYAYATTEVIPFQGKRDEILTLYLFYFLKTKIRKMLEKRMEGATGRKRVLQRILNDVTVFFPKSIEEQKAIIEKFELLQNNTKKLEEIYRKKIEDLEELKKSVLQKAFSGKL